MVICSTRVSDGSVKASCQNESNVEAVEVIRYSTGRKLVLTNAMNELNNKQELNNRTSSMPE